MPINIHVYVITRPGRLGLLQILEYFHLLTNYLIYIYRFDYIFRIETVKLYFNSQKYKSNGCNNHITCIYINIFKFFMFK